MNYLGRAMTNLYQLVTPQRIKAELGLAPNTLKFWRLGRNTPSGYTPPRLQEGVHWVRVSNRKVLYNPILLHDYLINLGNPTAHQRAIDAYLASLPSSQPTA